MILCKNHWTAVNVRSFPLLHLSPSYCFLFVLVFSYFFRKNFTKCCLIARGDWQNLKQKNFKIFLLF